MNITKSLIVVSELLIKVSRNLYSLNGISMILAYNKRLLNKLIFDKQITFAKKKLRINQIRY